MLSDGRQHRHPSAGNRVKLDVFTSASKALARSGPWLAAAGIIALVQRFVCDRLLGSRAKQVLRRQAVEGPPRARPFHRTRRKSVCPPTRSRRRSGNADNGGAGFQRNQRVFMTLELSGVFAFLLLQHPAGALVPCSPAGCRLPTRYAPPGRVMTPPTLFGRSLLLSTRRTG